MPYFTHVHGGSSGYSPQAYAINKQAARWTDQHQERREAQAYDTPGGNVLYEVTRTFEPKPGSVLHPETEKTAAPRRSRGSNKTRERIAAKSESSAPVDITDLREQALERAMAFIDSGGDGFVANNINYSGGPDNRDLQGPYQTRSRAYGFDGSEVQPLPVRFSPESEVSEQAILESLLLDIPRYQFVNPEGQSIHVRTPVLTPGIEGSPASAVWSDRHPVSYLTDGDVRRLFDQLMNERYRMPGNRGYEQGAVGYVHPGTNARMHGAVSQLPTTQPSTWRADEANSQWPNLFWDTNAARHVLGWVVGS